MPGRVVERQQVHGTRACARAGVGGVLPGAEGRALEGVMRELGDVRIAIGRVHALEGERARGVQCDPPFQWQRLIDGLAHEDVGEARRTRRHRLRAEHAGGDSLVDRGEHRGNGPRAGCRKRGYGTLATEDRRHIEHVSRLGRYADQALVHRLANRVRQLESRREESARAARGQQLRQRIDEQRVALAHCEHRRDERRRRRPAQRAVDPLRDGGDIEGR